jgi:hypothetical protein
LELENVSGGVLILDLIKYIDFDYENREHLFEEYTKFIKFQTISNTFLKKLLKKYSWLKNYSFFLNEIVKKNFIDTEDESDDEEVIVWNKKDLKIVNLLRSLKDLTLFILKQFFINSWFYLKIAWRYLSQ